MRAAARELGFEVSEDSRGFLDGAAEEELIAALDLFTAVPGFEKAWRRVPVATPFDGAPGLTPWPEARQGRDYYEAALKDPENAGKRAEAGEASCEELAYVAARAYEDKPGEGDWFSRRGLVGVAGMVTISPLERLSAMARRWAMKRRSPCTARRSFPPPRTWRPPHALRACSG